MCSGRHCRTTHSERMQGDTEPSQMVSINETWAMFHDGELSHSSEHLPACSDGPVTSWRASHRDPSLHPPGTAHHPAPSWPSSKTKRGWRYRLWVTNLPERTRTGAASWPASTPPTGARVRTPSAPGKTSGSACPSVSWLRTAPG